MFNASLTLLCYIEAKRLKARMNSVILCTLKKVNIMTNIPMEEDLGVAPWLDMLHNAL